MSDKTNRYNEIYVVLWSDIARRGLIQSNEPDSKVEHAAASLIRELRQAIERLHRIVDDGKPNEDAEDARIYRYADVWKLPKDVLVKVVWDFLRWHRGEDGNCPAQECKDYPCWFKKHRKEELDENLANGDLTQEDYDKYMNCIHEDICDCDDDGEGCWASYYIWCYLNGYNPLSGKKEAK